MEIRWCTPKQLVNVCSSLKKWSKTLGLHDPEPQTIPHLPNDLAELGELQIRAQ
jgi:hypothetical protein